MTGLKTPLNINTSAIYNQFKSAAKRQKLTEFVLNTPKGFSIELLAEGLNRGFRNRPEIEQVLVIYQNKVFYITKKHYDSGLIEEEIREELK